MHMDVSDSKQVRRLIWRVGLSMSDNNGAAASNLSIIIIKMTGETPEVGSDKRRTAAKAATATATATATGSSWS